MMNVRGIEDVSKMLAEFDFADIVAKVVLVFSDPDRKSYPYGMGENDVVTHDNGCYKASTYEIDVYKERGLGSNPRAWDEKAWGEWIEFSAFISGCDEECFIEEVYISYLAATDTDYNCEGVVCEACWSIDEKCWTGAIAYAASRGADIRDTHITLREFDIKSSNDIMNIVCQLTDIESHDFCVV